MFYKDSEIDFATLVQKNELKTPLLVYDEMQLDYTMDRINTIFSKYDFLKLSYAVKASYSDFFLSKFSSFGMGCDVASRYEYDLVKGYPFEFVTTTAPYYSIEDMKYFTESNILIDFNSLDQIKQFVSIGISKEIGIRARVKFPEWGNQNIGSYGEESRFGLELDQETLDYIFRNNLIIKRLHTHTGQMTPELLVYKVKYLLQFCKHFDSIDTINLGGGLLHLLEDSEKTSAAFDRIEELVTNFYNKYQRNITIIMEPGGAITLPFGYLITKVISKQVIADDTIVTVDSSAWNFLPWNIYKIENLSLSDRFNNSYNYENVKVAGCTLFEGDYFGVFDGKVKLHNFSSISTGDLLVVYASGGYSYTNSRKFNGMELPREYVVKNERR